MKKVAELWKSEKSQPCVDKAVKKRTTKQTTA